MDVLHDVEAGNADVARENGITPRGLQQMIDEARRGALAFGARDADGLAVELTEEQVGLRGDLHAFRVKVLQRDARLLMIQRSV